MQYTSRANIVGILAVADRPLKAGQLIRLAKPLGLSPNNVKSHLTRMVSKGILERTGTTRLATYRPSRERMAVVKEIQDRLSEKVIRPWNRKWLILTLSLPGNRSDRNQSRAWLWFDGFRPVTSNVFVRPSWPLPWAKNCALHYAATNSGTLFLGEFIDNRDNAGKLYDLDGLDLEARQICHWVKRRTVTHASPAKAFAEKMLVGGRVAHFIGHDPRLPEAIWGQRCGIKELKKTFRKFETRVAAQASNFITLATK